MKQEEAIKHYQDKFKAIKTTYLDRTFLTYEHAKGIALLAWKGRRRKPFLHYGYKTLPEYEKDLLRLKGEASQEQQWKDDQKAAKEEAASKIKVGDILYTSWGYEQTNVEFYQVVKKPSKWYVVVREIGKEMMPATGFSPMSGKCVAIKDKFVSDEELRRKITSGGSIRIHSSATASLWDESPCYVSWYG